MIRVLIVDDQRLMRDGLKTIVELNENIEVVGTLENGQQALEICEKTEVDVILMDIRMPVMTGVEATKLIKESYPHIKILVLTTFDDDEYIIDCLQYGATGYMLKDIGGESLINAIVQCYEGNFILPSNIAAKLVNRISGVKTLEKESKSSEVENKYNLTERELEIAKMLAQGFNNKQIASSLFLSEGTIKNNVSNIYSKINIFDRTSAVLFLKKLLKL